ncbi:hypothetical protein OS493_030128 [Desmophyllum pertusum]|uniref:BPTI/Kunitz inhibitor domain-containing protein n=1 Tax=Desmophyllum pertusum TaxID=174260 RepID=A0A9W9ZA91_9CNID|nr:hypothetical protein OS493_030128 [Desmophyllum pertusum]
MLVRAFVLCFLIASLITCTSGSANPCCLPKETGPCMAYFTRFFYDAATKKCKRFVYGGCGQNANNFESLEDCFNTCHDAVWRTLVVSPRKQDIAGQLFAASTTTQPLKSARNLSTVDAGEMQTTLNSWSCVLNFVAIQQNAESFLLTHWYDAMF